MTTFLDDHRTLYVPRLSCPPPYLDDPRQCRPYHLLPPHQHPAPAPAPAPPPPPPPPPALYRAPLQYHPTPPNHYPLPNRQDPPPAPHIPRRYYPYHVAHTPSPRAAEPTTYFVGTWSKDKFIDITSFMLDAAAEVNNDFVQLPTYAQPESVYFSVSRPHIPTSDYVRRLVTYTRCSPAAFVVMLIYIDRIAAKNTLLLVTPFNMHRLLVTALTLACKYLDDRCYSNLHYAKVGGIPTAREMNRLELQYLKYLDFGLHVTFEDYRSKLASLMNASPPSSPTSIMYHTSPVTTASSSPTSVVSPMEQRQPHPIPVERTLDFDGDATHYSLHRMVNESPAVDITLEPSYPTPKKSTSYPRHHHAVQSNNPGKWFHRKNSPREHTQRSIPKRSARRDTKLVPSLDPRFYHAAHHSTMPLRYAECGP